MTFTDRLSYLNAAITSALSGTGYPVGIQGNIFYEPGKALTASLTDQQVGKRERIIEATRGRKTMFEIGVCGGHSALWVLHHNPHITIHAVDLAEYDGYPAQVYVPAAMRALEELFPGRYFPSIGDCLTHVPQYLVDNPELQFDVVHIDGAKHTYTQDFYNLKPAMTSDCRIIFDDYNSANVRPQVDKLLDSGEVTLFLPPHSGRYTNSIVQIAP